MADDERNRRERLADHRAIGRLAEELLPSLIAKLGATGLGEIEVREGDWKVRLRRPADAGGPNYGRRAGDRPSRAQPGHAGHGHAPAAVEAHRTGRGGGGTLATAGTATAGTATAGTATAGSTSASTATAMTAVGPGPLPTDALGTARGDGVDPSRGVDQPYRAVATSPAVGVFQPRPEATAGTKVRAGDRLGIVDVLGVPQEVVAPVDGIVGASLVAAGEAVEYGQELIRIELAGARPNPVGAPAVGASAVGVPTVGPSGVGPPTGGPAAEGA